MPLGPKEFNEVDVQNPIELRDSDKVYRKLSKRDIAYRKAVGKEACGKCHYFIAPSACKIVEGHIEQDFTCDRFKEKVFVNKDLVQNIISRIL